MSSKRPKGPRKGLKKIKSVKVPDVQLNALITPEGEFAENFLKHNLENKVFKEGDVELIAAPYRIASIDNLISENSFIDELADELFNLELHQKNNDLYKFHQSNDLRNCDTPAILGILKAFKEKLQPWLQKVTGVSLDGELSMTYSKYSYTDTLLCHDDELDGRKIAYIYYLVSPTWCEADGGSLDLFSVDPKTGEPAQIEKSLIPKRNRLVFFEVTPVTYHQVSEVITEDKIRHSLVGWFQGPPVEREPHYEEPPIPLLPYGFVEERVLRAWINPLYLSEQLEAEVQKRFCDDGQTQLESFLNEDRYQAACEAFNDYNGWVETGPPNRRKAFLMHDQSTPEIIQELVAVLTSEAMFLILTNMTGLPLHPMGKIDREDDQDEDDADPKYRYKIRDWRHGAYTLVHDDMYDLSRCVLDANVFFNCEQWEIDYGGFISYIADDEELLTVIPRANTLSLVYREDGVLRFLKHVNHQMSQVTDPSKRHFQDIQLCYSY